MAHRFGFEFDAALIRAAIRRDILWRAVYAALAMVCLLVFLSVWNGAFDPGMGAIVALGVGVLCLLLFGVWRTSARRLFDLWSRQSPDHQMEFRLDDEGFDVEIGASSSRYAWQGLRRLWRYDDIWLIEVVKNVSVFFRPEDAPPEARAYFVEQCRRAGVRGA